MITKSGIKTAALKIGTAIISRVLSALLLRFQKPQPQPEEFKWIESFPEDEKYAIYIDKIGSSAPKFLYSVYDSDSVYQNLYFNTCDIPFDSQTFLKRAEKNCIRGYSACLYLNGATYLRLNGFGSSLNGSNPYKWSDGFAIDAMSLESIDFGDLYIGVEGRCLKMQEKYFPHLKRVRMTQKLFEQSVIPAGVQVYIKDYD